LRLSNVKSWLGHDTTSTIQLDKNSIFTHVVVKLHGGLVAASINPRSTTDSAGSSDLCRFFSSTGDILSDTLTNAAYSLNKVLLFNLILDKGELTETELLTSKVNVSGAISLSREESIDLHALAENDEISLEDLENEEEEAAPQEDAPVEDQLTIEEADDESPETLSEEL